MIVLVVIYLPQQRWNFCFLYHSLMIQVESDRLFFIDAGNVFSSNCSERRRLLKNCSDFDLGEMRYSVGIGVTYLSPFGPLTFYVAQPFGKDGDDTKTFDFTVGTGF